METTTALWVLVVVLGLIYLGFYALSDHDN
jgi:hypothetical protein